MNVHSRPALRTRVNKAWLQLAVTIPSFRDCGAGPGIQIRNARTGWHGRRIWIVRVRRALPGPGSPAAPRHDGVVVMRQLPHGSVAAREPEFAALQFSSRMRWRPGVGTRQVPRTDWDGAARIRPGCQRDPRGLSKRLRAFSAAAVHPWADESRAARVSHPPRPPEVPASTGLEGAIQGSRGRLEGSFEASTALRHFRTRGKVGGTDVAPAPPAAPPPLPRCSRLSRARPA
jgi:hypothetical protein